MKAVLTSILMSVVVLLAISSCATVPKEPLGPGDVRLLGLEIPENGNLKVGIVYTATITFEADGRPEIRRVCFIWPGESAKCARVKKVEWSDARIDVPFYALPDRNRLDCYVEYVRDGKARRTNTVFSHVTGR